MSKSASSIGNPRLTIAFSRFSLAWRETWSIKIMQQQKATRIAAGHLAFEYGGLLVLE